MQEDRIPKVFISYSWSSDAMVLELAQRLVAHGVDVVLDKWDLKEGQDKYAFMERSVNDPDITKVLIICDKKYAQKANDRTGGVGDETVIISSELYGNMNQEKFIPVIAEKDEEEKPYVPTYIKTRIYIDLSDENSYETEYEKLLRNIYEKPLIRKPQLGKRPEWLDDEKMNYFPLKDLIKQIKGSSTDKKRKTCIARFKDEYIKTLKEFWIEHITPEQEFQQFLNTKTLRDIFLDFLEVIAEQDDNYAEILASIVEEIYNELTNLKNFTQQNSGYESDIDLFKIHIWELFICIVTYMRHVEDYEALHTLLTYTYFLNDGLFGGSSKMKIYTEFRHHSRMIEEGYKPSTEQKNKYTLLGDVICNQREYLPIFSKKALANADLFLYQICMAFDFPKDKDSWFRDNWFPTFYVYATGNDIGWERMKSKRYCKKIQVLLGCQTIEEMKERVKKCEHNRDMRYNGSFDSAPSILDYIELDSIGTLN